jgi:hypothetical protein
VGFEKVGAEAKLGAILREGIEKEYRGAYNIPGTK